MNNNRIDLQRFDAPELAAYGALSVGVRTIEVTNHDQIDILGIDPNMAKPGKFPKYDRALILEVWYPSKGKSGGDQSLRVMLRDGKNEAEIFGVGERDAEPENGNFPLVIISHGFPGNRYLLSHLAENIASKGYIVVSIEHAESTYQNMAAFGSTLVNRPLDQVFVLNQIDALSHDNSSFLFGLVDTSNTALVGYSMGGYGALIAAGGGVTQNSVDRKLGGPHGTLGVHLSGSDSHGALFDPRIKTAIAFAPWGRNHDLWSSDTLSGVRIPILFFAGSQDEVSGYENGVRALWRETTNVDRALLTFDNAGHHAGAPMPVPDEANHFDPELKIHLAAHYSDAVWDSVRMNNISQHFVTAWLGKSLKHQQHCEPYLNLVENSNDGVWSTNEDGTFASNHTYWKGFHENTARGLKFEFLKAGR